MNPRQIRNWVYALVLIPVAVVVYPTWALYNMARFIWIGCDETWKDLQKPTRSPPSQPDEPAHADHRERLTKYRPES